MSSKTDPAQLKALEGALATRAGEDSYTLPVEFLRGLVADAVAHAKYEGRIDELIAGAELEMAKAEADQNKPSTEEWT